MLVLSRRVQERIVIGEDIEITVLKVSGNRVRLGIECERSIPVRRQELEIWRGEDRKAELALLIAART